MTGNYRMGFSMPCQPSAAQPDERHGNEDNGGSKGQDGAAPAENPDQSVCARKGQGTRKACNQGHKGNGPFCFGSHDSGKDREAGFVQPA